jgi:hypothetical protein
METAVLIWKRWRRRARGCLELFAQVGVGVELDDPDLSP